MFPCGPNQYLYNPYKQYCKMNGIVGWCDDSSCLLGDTEWERQACSLYCGENYGVNCPTVEDGTVNIWLVCIPIGVLLVIVIIMCGVIIHLCKYDCKKKPTPPVTKPSAPPMEKADPKEIEILIDNKSQDSDSAVGSSRSELYSGIPPQNNHEDPHNTRESRVAIAITSGTAEVRRQTDIQGETDKKECNSF